MTRTLVVGIGNVFFGDDGFGVEVAARLGQEKLPDGVRVMDAGIRARHLAYELVDGGYTRAIFVDAMPRKGAPGTLYLIEPDWDDGGGEESWRDVLDGHRLKPHAVLRVVRMLGGTPPPVLIVGCEPECVEPSCTLSAPVSRAVGDAVTLVRRLVEEP